MIPVLITRYYAGVKFANEAGMTKDPRHIESKYAETFMLVYLVSGFFEFTIDMILLSLFIYMSVCII